MTIKSFADLQFTLARGQQVGQMRRTFWTTATRLNSDMMEAVIDPVKKVERDGVATALSERRAAWSGLLDATTKVAAGCDALIQMETSRLHALALKAEIAAAATELTNLANADIPDELLPADLRAELTAILNGQNNPEHFAEVLLGLIRPDTSEDIRQSLAWFNELRLHALNAQLLSELSGVTPVSDSITEADLVTRCADMLDRAKQLRQAAFAGAKAARNGDASATWALTMWGAVFNFEVWLVEFGIPQLVQIASAASARVNDNSSNALRWAREAGLAYDALRTGLAYDAGVRAILLAYAAVDHRKIEQFAAISRLPLGSAKLDLPRSTPSQVAQAVEETVVEVDGLMEGFQSRVGGPSNRSTFTIGEGAVTILVPHVAADSFGLADGVWIQVRGKAFPNGKDGISGPVVMAGRIAGADAARASFTDALVHAGRDYFDLRPNDLDIVAGRVAGARATLNEIGMRE